MHVDSFQDMFKKEKWKKYNKKNFIYSDCSTCNGKVNLSLYNKTNGFLTEYSKTIPSEDMAEVFSHMMTLSPKEIKKIQEKDYILNRKIIFIKNNILKIDKNFKFPGILSIN